MEAVADTALCGELNHLVHHIAGTGHDEAYVGAVAKNLCGSFDKVLRTFLHGYTAEEGDNFFFSLTQILYIEQLGAERHNGVVYSGYLCRIDTVVVNHSLASEIRHGDYVVGMNHAVALDAIDRGIGLSARTVVLGSMNVNHQRLACDLLGMYSGRIGEPVVAMDDIEVERACNHTRGNRVVVDFLEKIRGIFAGELYASQVVWCAYS